MSGMQPDNNQIPPIQPPQQPFTPQVQQPMGQTPIASVDNKKSLNLLYVPLIVLALLFIGTLIFALMANSEKNRLQRDKDQIVAAEVAEAVSAAEAKKEAEFLQREKEPLKEYNGPGDFGGVSIKYPKTWSGYVTELDRGSRPVDGYFHPNFVPSLRSGTSFALRVEILERDYDAELDSYTSDARRGKVKIAPINAENVDGVSGVRIDGEVVDKKPGSVVLFPLRDKTLKLTSLSDQFEKDFTNIILKHLKFNK